MRYLLTKQAIRLYVWIGILVTVIVVPCSLYLTHRFSAYAYTQMSEFQQDRIAQTASRTDFLLSKLKAYSLNMYEDRTIRDWLQADRNLPLANMEALQIVSSYMATEPFLKRVYLVNRSTRAVLDSAVGVVPFEQFADPAMLNRLETDPPAFLQFFPHRLGEATYPAMLVPATPARKAENGYLAVLLDREALQAFLLENNERLGTEIWILDEQDRPVLGEREAVPAIGVLEESRASAERGTEAAAERGEERPFLNRAPLASQAWTVVSRSDLRTFRQQAESFRNGILGGSGLVLLCLLAAAFWNSRRVIRPFRSLAEQVSTRLSAEPDKGPHRPLPGDEYRILKDGIEWLATSVDEMKGSLQAAFPLAKAEYMRQWVLQGRVNQSVRNDAVAASGLAGRETLFLAVLKIDRYGQWAESVDMHARRQRKEAIARIAEETLASGGAGCEAVDLAGDHLVLLLGYDGEWQALLQLLERAKRRIAARTGLGVTIALSDRKHREDDLRAAYDVCLELAKLRFLGGEDRIYTEADYETYANLLQPLPEPKTLEHLIVAVKAGRTEELAERLGELFGPMAAMRYSECRVRLTVILFTIMKEFDSLSALQKVDGIDRQLDRFSTLAELRDWLHAELLLVMEQLGSRKSLERKDRLVEEMKVYLQARLQDPLLAAEDVADHISLSVKYARRLFQDIQGVTLSGYLLDLRIRKVKELLVTTSLPVAEIGEQSGFLTRSHFFTAFKKATGMTPSQYREHAAGKREEEAG